MTKDRIEPGEPAIGFSFDCKINDRRAVVIQTYLPIDSTPEQINAIFTKCTDAADRLEVKYRLKDLRLLLEKHQQELPMHEKDLAQFEEAQVREHRQSNRRGEFAWKGAAETNRNNKVQNVAALRHRVKQTEDAIKEAEVELGIKPKE